LYRIHGSNFGDKCHNLRLVTQLLPDCYNCYRLKRADHQIDIGHLGLFGVSRMSRSKVSISDKLVKYNASDNVVAAARSAQFNIRCSRRIWTIAKKSDTGIRTKEGAPRWPHHGAPPSLNGKG